MDETKKDEKVETAATSTESSSEPKEETKTESVVEEKKEEVKETPATEEKKEETKDVNGTSMPTSAEVPAKFKKIVEEIEKMSVLELNDLVKVFEDKFGVSATAATAGPAVAAGPVAEEKSEFDVELVDFGASKIAVIKVVKEALALGLKDAKDKVDAAPSVIAENVKKEDAENMKKSIEEAGGKVNLK